MGKRLWSHGVLESTSRFMTLLRKNHFWIWTPVCLPLRTCFTWKNIPKFQWLYIERKHLETLPTVSNEHVLKMATHGPWHQAHIPQVFWDTKFLLALLDLMLLEDPTLWFSCLRNRHFEYFVDFWQPEFINSLNTKIKI